MNPAYSRTIFQFIQDGEPDIFWFITAFNPDGITRDFTENKDADSRLHAELTQAGLAPFRVIGMSPSATHAEPDWGIPTDEATDLSLGAKFRQDALFHFSPPGIDLVNCKSGQRQPLAKPINRIHDPRTTRHFVLYLGSRPGHSNSDSDKMTVREIVGRHFRGFTIIQAEGWFDGEMEETLCIHLGTPHPEKVLEAAHALRRAFDQTGVGILCNGVYQRVREWSDDGMILQSFGIPTS